MITISWISTFGAKGAAVAVPSQHDSFRGEAPRELENLVLEPTYYLANPYSICSSSKSRQGNVRSRLSPLRV